MFTEMMTTMMMMMMMIFAKYTLLTFPESIAESNKDAHALKLSNSIIPSPYTYDPTGKPPPGGYPKTDA